MPGVFSVQIAARCPFCGRGWLLKEQAADCRVKCPKCRRLFKLPKLEDMPEAVKIVKQAKGTVYVDESGKTYG
jgi:phage FluMu protein Com